MLSRYLDVILNLFRIFHFSFCTFAIQTIMKQRSEIMANQIPLADVPAQQQQADNSVEAMSVLFRDECFRADHL